MTPPSLQVEEQQFRRLRRVYISAFAGLGLLLLLAVAVGQVLLVMAAREGNRTSVSAEQRTLTEQIARDALQIRTAPHEASRELARARLSVNLAALEQADRAVRRGDPGLGVAPPRGAARRLLRQTEPRHLRLAATTRSLLTRPPPSPDATVQLVDELLDVERDCLADAVELLALSEARHHRLLVSVGVTQWSVVILFIGVGVGVATLRFRPAVAEIRRSLTALRMTEDLLRQSEEGKHVLLQAIPDQMVRMSRRSAFLELKTGRPDPVPNGLSPKQWPRLAQVADPYVTQALFDGKPQEFSFQVGTEAGLRHLQIRLVVQGEDEVLAILQDVTERRALEQELLDAGTQERERIGRDLHDGLCQHLAGTTLMMQTLVTRVRKEQKVDKGDLETIVSLMEQGTAEARAVARGLFPVTVSNLGLSGALEVVADDLSGIHGVPVVTEIELQGFEPPPEVSAQLFRIAQEAVTNALKHAEASRIRLCLTLDSEEETLVLDVLDDGVGIGEARRADSMGLRIMDYRARLIGAFLLVERQKKGGTRVRCLVPASPAPTVDVLGPVAAGTNAGV